MAHILITYPEKLTIKNPLQSVCFRFSLSLVNHAFLILNDVDKFVEQSNNKLLTIQSVMYLNELLISINFSESYGCLLYTSDAADE